MDAILRDLKGVILNIKHFGGQYMKLNYPCCDAMAEKSHHDNVLKLFRQKAAHTAVWTSNRFALIRNELLYSGGVVFIRVWRQIKPLNFKIPLIYWEHHASNTALRQKTSYLWDIFLSIGPNGTIFENFISWSSQEKKVACGWSYYSHDSSAWQPAFFHQFSLDFEIPFYYYAFVPNWRQHFSRMNRWSLLDFPRQKKTKRRDCVAMNI